MAYMTTTEQPDLTQSLRMLYHLQPAQCMLLAELLTRKVVTQDELVNAGIAPTKNTVRVLVHRLKKFLDGKTIELQSAQGTGYWLAPIDVIRLNKEIHNFNYPEG